MCEFGMKQRVGRFGGFFADFPNADAIVDAAGSDSFAVWSKDNGVKLLERLRERIATLARCNVPQLDSAIGAGAGEDFAIGTKRQIEDAAVMSAEGLEFLAGLAFPQFNLLIVAASGEG